MHKRPTFMHNIQSICRVIACKYILRANKIYGNSQKRLEMLNMIDAEGALFLPQIIKR